MANKVGLIFLVKISALKPFWTRLYNMPIVPYTKFNNTLVMGSLVIGLIFFIPIYFLAREGVLVYRRTLHEKILKLKILQIIKASSFYKYYETFKGIRGR